MLECNNNTCDTSLLMARQSLYRFAAITLLDPQADAWEMLHALRANDVLNHAVALIRSCPEAVPTELARGERAMVDLDTVEVLRQLPASRCQLNEQYENTFGLLVSNACPPYETEYINGKSTFQRSNALADISGFYQAFGLTTSVSHPERSDHIVLELEFMAFLLDAQRRALSERHNGELAEICFRAQQRFASEHLVWWAPTFAWLLDRENPNGFYGAASRFLAALIASERSLLGIPVRSFEVRPSSIEHPDACESCLSTR